MFTFTSSEKVQLNTKRCACEMYRGYVEINQGDGPLSRKFKDNREPAHRLVNTSPDNPRFPPRRRTRRGGELGNVAGVSVVLARVRSPPGGSCHFAVPAVVPRKFRCVYAKGFTRRDCHTHTFPSSPGPTSVFFFGGSTKVAFIWVTRDSVRVTYASVILRRKTRVDSIYY